MRLTYLVSQYPAIHHTFILREIRELRRAGLDISVISIRPPDRPAAEMTREEREELARTRSVLGSGAAALATALLATLVSRPRGFFRGLILALRWGGAARAIAYLGYFAEAVVAGRWAQAYAGHVHSHFSSTVAALIAAVYPITLSVTFHGPDEFTDPYGFHLASKLRACRFAFAISQFASSQLMRFCDPTDWDKIEVSRLGVDVSIYHSRPHREHPDPLEVISVGRLAPVKAQRVLLEAAARLIREGRRLRLRLVGGGPDRQSLEQCAARLKIASHVVFEGWKNQDQVLELYRLADVFALASFAEGVPVVLMEAMAMEIPCVATWVAGIPELITTGEQGVLVAPSDARALAEALALLLDDPRLRQRMGEAGRRRVSEQYNLSTNCAGMAEIFRRRLS